MSAFTDCAVSGSGRTSGHRSFPLSEGSAPVPKDASDRPYSSGPPLLSEPVEGGRLHRLRAKGLPDRAAAGRV